MSLLPVSDAFQNLGGLYNFLSNPTGTPAVNNAKVTYPPLNQIDPKLLNPFGLNNQPAYPSAAKSLTSPTGLLGGNVGIYNGVNYGPTTAQATPQQPKTSSQPTTYGGGGSSSGGGSNLSAMEQQLAQMKASGKSMSNSKSYVSLYNKIKAAGGQTSGSPDELSGSGLADTAKNYITDLTNQYKQAIAGLTPLPQVYQGIEGNLGIPALQQAANNLTTTIANLPQTSLQRAQRYDLSQGQMQEYQSGEAQRLAPTAQSTYSALGNAQQEAANQLANVQQQYQNQLAPYPMAAQLAPEYTNMLAGLQSQNAASQLQSQKAMQDLGYLTQQQQFTASQPITIGDYLVNPQTGKVIGSYKSLSAAGSPSPTLSLNTTAGGNPTNLETIWNG